MIRIRPGWLVALCAGVLAVSVWLPWLTTTANGGGRVSAIGGAVGSLDLPPRFGVGQLIVLLTSSLVVAAAMAARGLSQKWAAGVACAISVAVTALTVLYHHLFVGGGVIAGYGFYIGLCSAVAAVVFSVWTLVQALSAGRRR
ncbi:hypothetical protein [Mycobacterium sp. ACS4331]|uniref:hypothetical protein n=1 Tax=Mycobacterium sp. ACS4331 TaxID=1834121 RepID=UPI0007FF9ECC|nr:hypothetical protein [Mycobacterium sp. ACS4331]OBF29650.1 hypothetical protein A5727_23510 [Mycobacterium sp. ACS4331]